MRNQVNTNGDHIITHSPQTWTPEHLPCSPKPPVNDSEEYGLLSRLLVSRGGWELCKLIGVFRKTFQPQRLSKEYFLESPEWNQKLNSQVQSLNEVNEAFSTETWNNWFKKKFSLNFRFQRTSLKDLGISASQRDSYWCRVLLYFYGGGGIVVVVWVIW